MTRRHIYLCAALYAEGRSDYDFLLPLIQRLLDVLGRRLFSGMVEVGETVAIDARPPSPAKRAERIAAAVEDGWDSFTLLVVHADGGGAPDEASASAIAPGVTLARKRFPSLIAVPCVPIREIEAWMLTDIEMFRAVLGRAANPSLPNDPEREFDPKQTLTRILQEGGWRRGTDRLYRLFGEEVRFEKLRALVSFLQFEANLCDAIRLVARAAD